MRSLYGRFVFHWLLESSIGGDEAAKERAKALEFVHGEVLEVGFGTGLNLPHYPASVRRLVALDPEEMLPQKVSQRIAAAGFPVERVRQSGVGPGCPSVSRGKRLGTKMARLPLRR